MELERHLDWEGCFNVRDLGGICAGAGRKTRWGAVVRSAGLTRMTLSGWSKLQAHGVRTIIDLRNREQRQAESYVPGSAEITCINIPLEEEETPDDTEFWIRWRAFNCTPLYYQAFLKHWPDRIATVVSSFAQANPGGVLIHCGVGRDRTGLIAMLLLALADVAPEHIAADYEMSADRLRSRVDQLGPGADDELIKIILKRENTSNRATILATLKEINVDQYLRSGGLSDHDLEVARCRLVEPL